MLRIQYIVKEVEGRNLFNKGRTIIHLATMSKVRAEVKCESLKKTYPKIADHFKIERNLIVMK